MRSMVRRSEHLRLVDAAGPEPDAPSDAGRESRLSLALCLPFWAVAALVGWGLLALGLHAI